MTMGAIIAVSFLTSLLLSAFTRVHPAACGCLLPILAAGGILLMVSLWPGGSTDAVAVPFAFIFAASGSIPGVFAGAAIKPHLLR